MICAGADGCHGGWLVCREGTFSVVPTFEAIWELGPLDVLAIDIPIGLHDAGRRACDVQARARLGARRSSVFAAPPRPLLECACYDEANSLSRQLFGMGISKQSYFLFPRIREVDAALRRYPEWTARTYECHPELSFAVRNGAPLSASKHTLEGLAMRRILLSDGCEWPELPHSQAGADDILDAAICLWSARRIARREHLQVPAKTFWDPFGLKMNLYA